MWRVNNITLIKCNKLRTKFCLTDVPLNETGFTGWSPSEPNGGVVENCLVIGRLSGLYADVACTNAFTFFCEQEL